MLRRLWRTVRLGAAAALALAVAVQAGPAPPSRIVAVGDLHGDFEVWRDIAANAGLVDSRGHWAGGGTTFVQLGDVVDRGPDSLKIIRELMRLQKEAPKSGGKVIVLVGNHEAMNVTGDLRYVDAGDYAAFATRDSAAVRDRLYEKRRSEIEARYRAQTPTMDSVAIREAWMAKTPLGWVEQRLAWAPDGEIGRWVIGNPAVAMIGGNLFVHGGLSAETAALPLGTINRRVASALKAVETSPESIINSPLGPLWYRGLTSRDPKLTEIASAATRQPIADELSAVLTAYGAKRIIIGHTPNLGGILIERDGRLVRVDSGNSAYYGGTPSWLEIAGDSVTPHTVARSAPGGEAQ